MLGIPRRYAHFVYAVIQSGLTCAIAAAIATSPMPIEMYLRQWLLSWLLAWMTMAPIVLLAAPTIRRLSDMLTRDQSA